jgi:hypothetical protein
VHFGRAERERNRRSKRGREWDAATQKHGVELDDDLVDEARVEQGPRK